MNLTTLEEWHRRASRATWCHHTSATLYSCLNTVQGLAVIGISAMVTILTSKKGHEDWVIILSTIGGVVASAQTFLTPSQRANAHKSAGAAYSTIRRSIEKVHAECDAGKAATDQCERLEAQLKEQAAKCPTIPIGIWWYGESKYKKSNYNFPTKP